MHRAGVSAGWGGEQTELRWCSDAVLAPAQEAAGRLSSGGVADVITPVVNEKENDCWAGCYAERILESLRRKFVEVAGKPETFGRT